MKKRRWLSAALAGSMCLSMWGSAGFIANAATANNTAFNKTGNMVVEYLDRGISAVNTGLGMLVSWRFLASDPEDAVFKLYRDNTLIYTSTEKDNSYSKGATCFLDAGGSAGAAYRVETYSGGTRIANDTCLLKSSNAYFDVKLDRPGSQYTPNDMSVGDVDGDGVYELFVKWDPSNSKDNSQKGKTDKVYIDCYKIDGTKLWRIDLGVNIRAGAHYTQFYVADFDLDGVCEMTCKTADGTIDGTGKAIGDASKDYRDSSGFIITGPEYYTLFDGATGAALDTVNYEPDRGNSKGWGKSSDATNRVDRFWGTTAYLDGVHPCVVTGRGYYGRMTATAYKVEDKKLVKMWTFDTGTSTSAKGYGDGNHNSMAADVDSDGKQEICNGPAIIDDDGTLYYTTGQGHGDAMHLGDLDPSNPGLELWICHEEKKSGYGVSFIDCDKKSILFHNNGAGDTGRCCADNIWAGNAGAELWGNKESDNSTPVKNVSGDTLSCRRPAINFLSYWDGDLEREILDGYTDSPATISKMKEDGTLTTLLSTDGCYTCNTTKGTPCLSADIFGDWREELIVRAAAGDAIRIYATTYDTDYRVQCLMHDPQYRTQVSAQNTAYNQPPHTSFFLGTGYDMPARPACTVREGSGGSTAGKPGAQIDTDNAYRIKNVNSGLYLTLDPDADNDVVQKAFGENVWTLEDAGDGYYRLYSTYGDGRTYLLDLDYGKTDNGTNIHVYTDTQNDAQLFKLVDNGDGSYAICTKNTNDQSCVGVTGASKDEGASAVEWSCNDSSDQKWTLEICVDPIDGKLVKELQVLDTAHYKSWKINANIAVGDLAAGDRDYTYTALPEVLTGAESILVPCDSKYVESDLAAFTAAQDETVYIALDTRVTSVPAWMSGYTKTDMTAQTSNDVTLQIYELNVKAGDTVTLGSNGQSASCINYTVFVMAAQTPTEHEPTEPTTEPTEPTTEPIEPETTEPTASDTVVYGDVNCDGEVDILDVIKLNKYLLGSANDISEQGKINANVDNSTELDTIDSLNILKCVVKIITLPVA